MDFPAMQTAKTKIDTLSNQARKKDLDDQWETDVLKWLEHRENIRQAYNRE